MNHSPSNSNAHRSTSNSLSLPKAITGFLNYKTAEGLSDRSIDSYKRILEHWADYAGEKKVGQLTDHDINAYSVFMRTEYIPRWWSGDTRALSLKTLRNIWITMCSFFTWAQTEFRLDNPMKHVPGPRFQKVDVEPFTREEISRMLKACMYSREADTLARRQFVMRRATAHRDQAILLTLLDSGVRASEFCSLRVGDFEAKRGKLEIRHGVGGGAKGGKGRTVYLGKTARHAVWRYLAGREDGEDASAPLFTVRRKRAFNPSALRHLIKSIAARCDVKNAYPHKFRHTFAITYLRAGGDVFTLQSLLGHGSLDMVRHYAKIAQMDVEQAHRKASPADNWRLFRYLESPNAADYHVERYEDVINRADSMLVAIDKQPIEEIYYWRGMAKAALGDREGAVEDMRQAQKLSPNLIPTGEGFQCIAFPGGTHSAGFLSKPESTRACALQEIFSNMPSQSTPIYPMHLLIQNSYYSPRQTKYRTGLGG
jgi:integrase/recombinase XerD